MLRTETGLPLALDASSRFLPWLIAFMVYLAAMALTATMVLSGASANWRQGLSGTMTVQVIPLGSEEDPQTLNRRVKDVLQALRKTPGIETAEMLSHDKLAALLEPWLGKGPLIEELPLPRLIDVRIAAGDTVDIEGLESRLAAFDRGTVVDDHGLWLDRLITLAGAIEIIALVVMVLICVSAIAAAVFTTRTGLAIHHDVIELLHLMGAQDDYVARQFQVHAFWLGLKGGLIGLGLTVVTLLVLGYLGRQVDTTMLPSMSLSVLQWVGLVVIPAVAALISMLTARFTVLRTLARMP